MKKRKPAETAKNIFILLLLVSAVFLGWQSQLFGNTSVKLSALANPADGKTAGDGNGIPAAGTKTSETRPVSIAVTSGAGMHYGSKYDLDMTDEIYENAILIIRDALGTAQKPEKTGESAWHAALQAPGIFFEYMSPMRLSVLDGWFGAEIAGEWRTVYVRRLCVAVVDGAPLLYFQDDETGFFYVAETDALPEDIAKLTGKYAANNAAFAFEMLKTPLENPYALIMREPSDHPVFEAKNPLTGETLAKVLRWLGVSEHLKPITDEDGNEIFIQPEDFRIELSPDGSPEIPASPADESGAIEQARQAVAESIGKYCGESARVYFDAVTAAGPGSYEVLFAYVVAGGRGYMDRGSYAASVTVTDGVISKMTLFFRSFEEAGENGGGLLPEIQAAAASGGAFMLCYKDNGTALLEPSWIYTAHVPERRE
jgi:hypothetical protein